MKSSACFFGNLPSPDPWGPNLELGSSFSRRHLEGLRPYLGRTKFQCSVGKNLVLNFLQKTQTTSMLTMSTSKRIVRNPNNTTSPSASLQTCCPHLQLGCSSAGQHSLEMFPTHCSNCTFQWKHSTRYQSFC